MRKIYKFQFSTDLEDEVKEYLTTNLSEENKLWWGEKGFDPNGLTQGNFYLGLVYKVYIEPIEELEPVVMAFALKFT